MAGQTYWDGRQYHIFRKGKSRAIQKLHRQLEKIIEKFIVKNSQVWKLRIGIGDHALEDVGQVR